jgi:hypothetical protein
LDFKLRVGDKVIATEHPSGGHVNELMTVKEQWIQPSLNEPAWIMEKSPSWYYKESWLLLVEPGDIE